ncbi:hypothetical protein BGZ99_001510, partial [Dissophora globulifera]
RSIIARALATDGTSHQGLSSGAIVGIAVGSIALISILGGFFGVLVRGQRRLQSTF